MKDKHVAFMYMHFWPDSPPYANMLRVIGNGLVDKGCKVSVITAQPSYKQDDRGVRQAKYQDLAGIKVQRLSNLPFIHRVSVLRSINRILFPARAFFSLLCRALKGNSPDVLIAATMPPVLNGVFGLAISRLLRIKFIYHIQDIYPEIGLAGGLWKSNSIIFRLLKTIDSFVTKKADCCVVLSGDMRKTLIVRGVDPAKISSINNFQLESFGSSETVSESTVKKMDFVAQTGDEFLTQPKRLVFAGNLGRFQALDRLVMAFLDERCSHLNLELHFLGDGREKQKLINLAGACSRIKFLDHVSFDKAATIIASYDAGIVSVSNNVLKYAYPSKTLTYLGLNLPLLVFADNESELLQDVFDHDLGIGCADQTLDGMVQSFLDMFDWLSRNENTNVHFNDYIQLNTSSNNAIEKWSELLNVHCVSTNG